MDSISAFREIITAYLNKRAEWHPSAGSKAYTYFRNQFSVIRNKSVVLLQIKIYF
jgi:hypothetical protein